MYLVLLRGRWCHIIVLKVHALEDKIDYVKDSFYDELKRVFDKFPKYYLKILWGDFNVEVGREDIFKQTIGNESLHEINNDIGVINFATVKFAIFPHLVGYEQLMLDFVSDSMLYTLLWYHCSNCPIPNRG
jgi:hypothetical protein